MSKKAVSNPSPVQMMMPEVRPGRFEEVALEKIKESPHNPRRHFTDLEPMAESMKVHGVVQPIVLAERNGGPYLLVSGARRFRAAKLAGLATIPSMVRELTDAQVAEIQCIENDQRADVNPMEQALSYARMIDELGYDVAKVAAKTGRAEPYVKQRMQLVELAKPWQAALLDGRIGLGHALLVARLVEGDQTDLFKKIFWGKDAPAPSVGELRSRIAREYEHNLAIAAFPKDDGQLMPSAGACITCPRRTGYNLALFPDAASKDICTEGTCFRAKTENFLQRQMEAAAAQSDKPVVKVSSERWSAQKGVIDRDQYEPCKPTDPEARTAVVVDGEGVGKVMSVKVWPGGENGGGRSGGSAGRQDAAEKRRREKEEKLAKLQSAVLDAILAKISASPTIEALRRLASTWFDRLWADHQVKLCQRHGWERPANFKGHGHEWRTKVVRVEVAQMTPAELHRFIVEASLMPAAGVSQYSEIKVDPELVSAAKEYGVEVEKVRASIESNHEETKGTKKAPAKKAGKGKGKQ